MAVAVLPEASTCRKAYVEPVRWLTRLWLGLHPTKKDILLYSISDKNHGGKIRKEG